MNSSRSVLESIFLKNLEWEIRFVSLLFLTLQQVKWLWYPQNCHRLCQSLQRLKLGYCTTQNQRDQSLSYIWSALHAEKDPNYILEEQEDYVFCVHLPGLAIKPDELLSWVRQDNNLTRFRYSLKQSMETEDDNQLSFTLVGFRRITKYQAGSLVIGYRSKVVIHNVKSAESEKLTDSIWSARPRALESQSK